MAIVQIFTKLLSHSRLSVKEAFKGVYMKETYPGVLENSHVYFHTASAQARKMFFYVLCTGHYHCNERYSVDRQNYNSFLILYVQSGTGYVEQDGKAVLLKAGSLFFMDCYRPHKYYTRSRWEIYWVHFDGILARPYFETVTEQGITLFPRNPYSAERCLKKLFDAFHEKSKVNEALLSKFLTDLFTELILCVNETSPQKSQTHAVEDTLAYISENADQALSLDLLSRRVALSPFYFTRVFKKETGYTPHEYILRARVDLARFFLKTTDYPIKEIAFRSGFNSEASFCTTFKKATGLTPKAYRAHSM